MGGFDTLAMGDVNKTLSQWDGNLSKGWEGGVGVSYGFTPRILANVGISEIFDQDYFNGGSISLPALSFLLGVEYVVWPGAFKDFDLSVAGGGEYDMLDGNTSIDPGQIEAETYHDSSLHHPEGWSGVGGGGGAVPTGTAPSGQTYVVTNCVGQTVGAQLSLKGRYFMFTHLALGLAAGYRYAHVYNVMGTTNGVTSREQESVDYSGLITRLDATYYF